MTDKNSSESDITIDVKNVSKSFGPHRAVQSLSFSVKRGEIVGFLGPNGAGKTTTMRLLTSYYTPDTGQILIDGIDNSQQDIQTRRSIGYLPENNPLYEDLLVREYLDFIADLRGMSGKERKENTDRMQEVETTCERVLVINQGHLVADSPVEELLQLTPGLRKIYIEVEGAQIENGLSSLESVESFQRLDPIGNRKRYEINLSGSEDPRPEIFRLAVEQNWILWDLHEERMRLEDVFHSLTSKKYSGMETA